MLKNKKELLDINGTNIINQLRRYNILNTFSSKKELERWILKLNSLEVYNILSLSVNPEDIKFDSRLLIDKNLLNTIDYNKRIEALVSIKNADGWYHLFDRMLRPEFLNSSKFFQDIETLKRAECAQTPLWIIGEPVFINSPYHDEDFELLVTSKDTSEKKFDHVVWDAIATVAGNEDSINSKYHRQDLQTIVKYGSKALQLSNSFPKRSINCLATNPVSLRDNYHLENMKILANNMEIGNFLYAVMTNENAVLGKKYRVIIEEMLENKNNGYYVFLLCYYAIGKEEALNAQNVLEHNYYYEITRSYDIKELLKKVDEKINIIDSEYIDVTTYEIECHDIDEKSTSIKNPFKKRNLRQ